MSRSAFVMRTRVGEDGTSLESRMSSGGLSGLYEAGVSLESRMLSGGLRGLNPSRWTTADATTVQTAPATTMNSFASIIMRVSG